MFRNSGSSGVTRGPGARAQSDRTWWHMPARLGLRACLLAMLAPGLAFAQATPPTANAESAAPIEEVVVTGSRIPQPNLTSVSPIQVVSAQEILQNGTTDMSTLINTLPQQFQNSVADFSNTTNPLTSAGGLTTADLRGLGPQRTLVLVNGRRLGVGDASTLNPNPAPDLDQIPTPLVQRIDVVTGGASAVYGSDAIAGVVNFVLKRNFEGVQLDGQYGIDQHDNGNSYMQGLETAAGFNAPHGSVWDGQNRQLSIIAGSNFAENKGNVTGYFVYMSSNPVGQGTRDFSACKLNVTTTTNPNLIDSALCSGSPNSNQYQPSFGTANLTVVGNQLLPWPQANSSPPALFNSSPYQFLSRGDTRYTAGFMAHYEVNEYFQPYTEFNYMNDRSDVQIGPGGIFEFSNPFNPSGTGGLLVNCTIPNPMLSAQQKAALCAPANFANGAPDPNNVDVIIGRRDIEGGPRGSSYEHNNWRGVFGFKSDFADAWTGDFYASDYYTSLYQNNTGYLSATRTQNALLVVTDPTTGKPVCQGGQAGCVPYNIWQTGGVTPDQLAYLLTNGTNYGTVNERIINASVTGELGKYGVQLPTANEGVAVVAGFEHRNESLSYAPDQAELSNDLMGFSGAGVAVNGSYHVSEGFAEVRIPLVEQKPWFEDLVLHGAYRRSDYSTAAGNVNTYAVDLQWAPTADFRLRGSFQRAIRAPNIIELFTPQSVTNTSDISSDPCAGPAPAATLAACEHTGVTPAQYGHILQCPAGQCATLTGGNPNLAPETANTITYGVTFTPTFLTGFTASVDYYHIILKDEIGAVPLTTTLNGCLAGDLAFCSGVVRSSIGTLTGTTVQGGGWVSGTNVNVAVSTVEGIDTQLAYRLSLPGRWGSLTTTLNGTYNSNSESQPTPAATRYNCVGLYGPTCQTLNPRWRSNLRLDWNTPVNVLASVQWRYIGSVKLDTNTGQPALTDFSPPFGPGVYDATFDAKLPAVSYIDLSAIWTINKTYSVRAGCNNVFDKAPPLVASQLASTGSPNTYPTYDLLGRAMFIAGTATF